MDNHNAEIEQCFMAWCNCNQEFTKGFLKELKECYARNNGNYKVPIGGNCGFTVDADEYENAENFAYAVLWHSANFMLQRTKNRNNRNNRNDGNDGNGSLPNNAI